jgi:fatty-acyl-CoA synthase
MFIDMLNRPDFSSYDLSSLETGAMAGAPCPETLVKRVRNEMNMRDFSIFFGMTETSPVTCQSFLSDSEEVRATTVGFPHEHIELKVVDSDGDFLPV